MDPRIFDTDLLKRNDPNSILLQSFAKKSGFDQKIHEITRPNKREKVVLISCNVRKVSTPWTTPVIFNMIKEKQTIVKEYKVHKHADTLKRMRILRNYLHTKIDKAMALYIENQLHLHGKNI